MAKKVENAEDLRLKKAKKLAIIMPATEKALLRGAIIFIGDELLKNFPNFNVEENLFLCNAHDFHKPDLRFYDKILVIDPENKFLKPEKFITKNYKTRKNISWYLGSKSPRQKLLIIKEFSGENNLHYCEAGSLINLEEKSDEVKSDMIRLSRSLNFIEEGKRYQLGPRQLERIRKAIYITRRDIQAKNSTQNLLKKTMQQLFFELILKQKTPLITDLILDFNLLEEAERIAKRKKVKHPLIGRIKIVKPKKGSTVENKTFFENGFKLGFNAVAVRSSIDSGEYELCLKKNLAEKIADKIPAIRRINGCRFIVKKEFLIPEPVE